MSVPRLLLCGLEPGPALALAAGALLEALSSRGAVRPVTIGLDMPLWRLLVQVASRAPRALDPALYDDDTLDELYDVWADDCDLLLMVGVEPALDRWAAVPGSRAVDLAAKYDMPLVLVVDARDRGPTAGAAVCGVRSLVKRVEIAGVIVVGGEERDGGAELAHVLRRGAGLPILGWIPPQLSEQFVRQFAAATTAGPRQLGPRPARGSETRLCAEAATYLNAEELAAATTRRGYLPSRARRLFTPVPAATGLTLAVAWGPPLEPFALENLDMLHAMGLEPAPVDLTNDHELPADASGLLLSGQLEEEQLAALAANRELLEALAAAVGGGLPTLALGGGALLLLRRLADSHGRGHDLAGVLPAEAEVLEWYARPRYVPAVAAPGNPFDQGETLLRELFDLEFLWLEQGSFAYLVGDAGEAEGFAVGRCLATVLYPSLPRSPGMAAGFVEAMRLAGPAA
jgi:cobyrinic acid a,c-diamide synthase